MEKKSQQISRSTYKRKASEAVPEETAGTPAETDGNDEGVAGNDEEADSSAE